MKRAMVRALVSACVALGLRASGVDGAVQPKNRPATEKEFRHADLYIREYQQKVNDLAPSLAASAGKDLTALGIEADSAFFDDRVGRWSSLILHEPLIPGTGQGNSLRWPGTGVKPSESVIKDQAWAAVNTYLANHQGQLRLDSAEFGAPRVTVLEKGALVYVYVPRVVGGISVRNSSIGATINHGNLVLLGLQNWGDVNTVLTPGVTTEQARSAVGLHASPFVTRFGTAPHLELIPMAGDASIYYRLVWVVDAGLDGDVGQWEGLVDARNGELVAFEDKNDYAQRTISGGVYPVSNDQRPTDGVEQTGWPMPYADIHISGNTIYTDAGGNIGCAVGTISTSLSGLFLRMTDTCGAMNDTSTGSLDLGSGPLPTSTDCTVPGPGHSAGDTKASRTGYFELNQLISQAKGWLPGNTWLEGQLNANMNLNQTCNAFWDGTSVNFFKSGGGCANTGEEAAIFDHEWGHGLDDNGANPAFTNPGESTADISAMMRLNATCIGRGFFPNALCGGYGDACLGPVATGCTGVRDDDFANHRCGLPHTVSWVVSGFTVAQCPSGAAAPCPSGGGPCGREVHCEGYVAAETAWDLRSRDLIAAPFNYDSNTALEVTTRLYFLGTQPITNWYTCSVGGGCGATGGYLSFLAADDDDGNITNGTPHMTAIRAAFERHEIHCATPAPLNSGCAGGPTEAPTVTVTPFDTKAVVSWNAVEGADSYYVYRTDGVHGCDFGKIKIGTTSDLTLTDSGLQNGRTYYYTVIPVGSNLACMGPMSACAAAVPTGAPNLGIQAGTELSITGGDGDAYLDNCEVGTVTFSVANTGTGTLTNVRLVAVTPLTHPLTEITTTLPEVVSDSLGDACNTAQGSFSFIPHGMTFGQSTQLQLEVTADELFPDTRTQIVTINNVETDGIPVASRTYHFDALSLEGWTITSGTYSFAAPGANGTGFHVTSSSGVANACDIIDSPEFVMTATSTLSLYDRYTTETPIPIPYDRANVGIRDVASDTRTTIIPSSGRLYDLPAGSPNGTCVTNGQAGFAGTKNTFAVSGWDASHVNPGGAYTGHTVKLEVAYATDDLSSLAGFDFDEVTLTNIMDIAPDAQDNSCVTVVGVAPASLEVDAAGNDVLEPNETVLVSPSWTNTGNTPVTMTGIASTFTGPTNGGGDPTYAITDANGAYGSIAVSSTGKCPDPCYSLSLTTVTRPVKHWDVTFNETVAPVAALTNGGLPPKTWTLHVGNSFADVSTDVVADPYYPAIEALLHTGVTTGCGDGTVFCPTADVLRQEMAVFIIKAANDPPAACAGLFNDVPCDSIYAPYIEELSNLGITGGCQSNPGFNPPVFCPEANVLRQEMAVFLINASGNTTDPCTGMFNDVPCDSIYAPYIEKLANLGVTAGCQSNPGFNPPVFCPEANVLRQEMAVFLVKKFALALYGP